MVNKNVLICLVYLCVFSSRSHLVFMITVRGQDKASGAVSTGTLTLCDLAGSERVSKSEATGQRLTEAAAINKSLSALGQVRMLPGRPASRVAVSQEVGNSNTHSNSIIIHPWLLHDLLSCSYRQHCVWNVITGRNSLQTACLQ